MWQVDNVGVIDVGTLDLAQQQLRAVWMQGRALLLAIN